MTWLLHRVSTTLVLSYAATDKYSFALFPLLVRKLYSARAIDAEYLFLFFHIGKIFFRNCTAFGASRWQLAGFVCAIKRGKSRDEKENAVPVDAVGIAKCAAWICPGVRRKVAVIDIPGT